MDFKRIMKYIIPVEKQIPTGDVDEQSLFYQKVEGRWELVYDYYRDSAGHEYENQRIGNLPRIEDNLPHNGIRTINPTVDYNGNMAIVIEGTISYDGDNIMNDNFRLRTEIKEQMMFEVQRIFDEARSRIREQKKRLDDLLAKYEHLPIKG
jgi:hypothetical protein